MPNRPLTQKEREAWTLAEELHSGQIRKFIGKPYFEAHVQKVNGIVKQYTTEEDLLCASLLHDTIEDCFDNFEEGYELIKSKFGKRVADIVVELTSNKDEIEKYGGKAEYLMSKMVNMSEGALTIKLADRLQNISDAFTASEKFRNKYFEETSKIVDALEKHRRLNRIQRLMLNEIKGKLKNISSIFKIKRFKDFDETPEII